MNKENEQVIKKFLEEICSLFPEIEPLMDKHEEYMPTSKMEEFANATTKSFGRENKPERGKAYLEYMSKKLDRAKPIEHEFIDVYFVESLFWDTSNKGVELGWSFTPDNLRKLYVDFHKKEPPL